MNKKLILLGSFAMVIGGALQACRLTVINDTDKSVIFQSHKEGKHRLQLNPGESKPFGEQVGVENHGEMADFDLTIVGSQTAPIRVKQVKCNVPKYKTFINASEVLNKKFVGENEQLFTFDAEAPITCGR